MRSDLEVDTLSCPDILYEDNHIIVAIKPAGMLSQADDTGEDDMLTEIKAYIKVKYDKPGNVFLGLVHRLDRPVSGVMVFARTSKAASRLSDQIRRGEMVKQYRAVVEGDVVPSSGRIENWLTKDRKTNMVTVSGKPIGPESKLSSLKYETSATSEYGGRKISLVEIELETGRSHQIRAQMSHKGNPLMGDARYGSGSYRGDICLQSCKIAFRHPVTAEPVEFTAPFPKGGPWDSFA